MKLAASELKIMRNPTTQMTTELAAKLKKFVKLKILSTSSHTLLR